MCAGANNVTIGSVDDDYVVPIMEALLDIRLNTEQILYILGEDDDEQEGEAEEDP